MLPLRVSCDTFLWLPRPVYCTILMSCWYGENVAKCDREHQGWSTKECDTELENRSFGANLNVRHKADEIKIAIIALGKTVV
jgi:hypothetical protein